MKNLSILFGFVLIYLAVIFVNKDASKIEKSKLEYTQQVNFKIKSGVISSEKSPIVITKKD